MLADQMDRTHRTDRHQMLGEEVGGSELSKMCMFLVGHNTAGRTFAGGSFQIFNKQSMLVGVSRFLSDFAPAIIALSLKLYNKRMTTSLKTMEQDDNKTRIYRNTSYESKWPHPHCSRVILDPLSNPQIKKNRVFRITKKTQPFTTKPLVIQKINFEILSHGRRGHQSMSNQKELKVAKSLKDTIKNMSEYFEKNIQRRYCSYSRAIRSCAATSQELENPLKQQHQSQSIQLSIKNSLTISRIETNNPVFSVPSRCLFRRTQNMKTHLKQQRKCIKSNLKIKKIEITQIQLQDHYAKINRPDTGLKENEFSPWNIEDQSKFDQDEHYQKDLFNK